MAPTVTTWSREVPVEFESRRVRLRFMLDIVTPVGGLCCVVGSGRGRSMDVNRGSDCFGQFIERGCNGEIGKSIDTEFVMAPSEVLHERMATNHDRRRAVTF